jgi:hypothetical protein
LFVQHAWLWAPQPPQLPLEQLPVKLRHVLPLETQVLFTQQPPFAHVVAEQQTSPAPPQAVHMSLRQTVLLALQAVPVVQQACPAPPQLLCEELQESQSNAAPNTAARKTSRVMVKPRQIGRGAASPSA